MAVRNMKIKVRVADLLGKVEQARTAAVANHDAAVKKWERQRSALNDKVVESLKAALADVTDHGKLPEINTFYRGGNYRAFLVVPSKATEVSEPQLSLTQFDRDIAILKMASDDVLSISADDNFGRYL